MNVVTSKVLVWLALWRFAEYFEQYVGNDVRGIWVNFDGEKKSTGGLEIRGKKGGPW